MEYITLVQSSFSATINAPIEKLDIRSPSSTPLQSEYHACSPIHLLCRGDHRPAAHRSADVAPKRHTAPRARLQAFSVISSERCVTRPEPR